MTSTQTTGEDPLVRLQGTEVSLTPHVRSSLLKRQMPGLDVLRGLAVLAVIADHGFYFLPEPWMKLPVDPWVLRISHVTHDGWLGVNLFFILSGFLITGILIDSRRSTDYWRNFYVRRVLRILPLYFILMILLRVLLPINWVYFVVCMLYAANLAIYLPATGVHYDPVWSLAVEEQFYLVWPLIVRRLSLRSLAMLCVAIAAFSPVLRGLSAGSWHWLGDPYTATWLVSDNLAWGSLIAVFMRSPLSSISAVRRLTAILFLVGACCFVCFSHLHWLSRTSVMGAAFQLLPFQLIFIAAVLLALQIGDRPWVLRITAPLRFYGYISYGLYLIHLLLFIVINRYFTAKPERVTLWVASYRFALVLLAATAISFVSRRYFEESFLKLKSKLAPYKKANRPAPAATN